jgi:hypothetical protein
VEAVTRADLAELAGTLLASRPTLASIGPVKRLPRAEEIGARLAGAVTADA